MNRLTNVVSIQVEWLTENVVVAGKSEWSCQCCPVSFDDFSLDLIANISNPYRCLAQSNPETGVMIKTSRDAEQSVRQWRERQAHVSTQLVHT